MSKPNKPTNPTEPFLFNGEPAECMPDGTIRMLPKEPTTKETMETKHWILTLSENRELEIQDAFKKPSAHALSELEEYIDDRIYHCSQMITRTKDALSVGAKMELESILDKIQELKGK